MPIRLVVDGDAPIRRLPTSSVAPRPADRRPAPEEDTIDPDELTDAPEAATSGLDRITAAFPGAELVTEPTPSRP